MRGTIYSCVIGSTAPVMRVVPGILTGPEGLMTWTLFLWKRTERLASQNFFTERRGMVRSLGLNLWQHLAAGGRDGIGRMSVLLDRMMLPFAVSTGSPEVAGLWCPPVNVSWRK